MVREYEEVETKNPHLAGKLVTLVIHIAESRNFQFPEVVVELLSHVQLLQLHSLPGSSVLWDSTGKSTGILYLIYKVDTLKFDNITNRRIELLSLLLVILFDKLCLKERPNSFHIKS